MKYEALFEKVKDLVRDEAAPVRPSFSVDDDDVEFAMRSTLRATLHSLGLQVAANGDVCSVAPPPAPAWQAPKTTSEYNRRQRRKR